MEEISVEKAASRLPMYIRGEKELLEQGLIIRDGKRQAAVLIDYKKFIKIQSKADISEITKELKLLWEKAGN